MSSSFDRFVIDVPRDEVSSLMKALRFDIRGFGYFLQQDDGQVPAFSIRDYEWVLYTQGNVHLCCEGVTCDTEPGDLVLLEPGKTYSASCFGSDPVHYYYVHFRIEPDYLMETYISAIFGHTPERIVHAGTIPDFAPQFSLLLKDRMHGEPGTLALIHELMMRMSVYMMRRLRSLQESSGAPEVNPRGEDLRMCAQAIAIMRANLGSGLRIQSICEQMGVSMSYLYKLFARVFHQSPSQYLMDERLQCVCHLLTDEGCTVAEAADRLGFASASHLSMQFKKNYGVTPRQWMKNLEPQQASGEEPRKG